MHSYWNKKMKLIMVYKILYALLLHSAYAAVWNFEQSGKFTGEDVTFTSTVTLNGDLEITGPGPEQLATFIAASNNRHFITSAAILLLRQTPSFHHIFSCQPIIGKR